MLNDTCIRNISLRIIHHGITLIVTALMDLLLKAYRSIFQLAETITIELINLTGKYNLISQGFTIGTIRKEINVHPSFHSLQQTFDQFIVASHRNS